MMVLFTMNFLKENCKFSQITSEGEGARFMIITLFFNFLQGGFMQEQNRYRRVLKFVAPWFRIISVTVFCFSKLMKAVPENLLLILLGLHSVSNFYSLWFKISMDCSKFWIVLLHSVIYGSSRLSYFLERQQLFSLLIYWILSSKSSKYCSILYAMLILNTL